MCASDSLPITLPLKLNVFKKKKKLRYMIMKTATYKIESLLAASEITINVNMVTEK